MDTQFRMTDSPAPQRVRISWEMVRQPDGDASPYDTDNASSQRKNDWLAGRWCFVGVIARARIFIPIGGNSFATYTLDSPGLWGVESDSGDAYFREVFEEQKKELRSNMETLSRALIGADELAEEDAE